MFCYSESTKIIGNCAAYELIFRYRIRFCLYSMEQLQGIPKIACVSNEMSAGKQLISSFEYSISYICYAGIPFLETRHHFNQQFHVYILPFTFDI